MIEAIVLVDGTDKVIMQRIYDYPHTQKWVQHVMDLVESYIRKENLANKEVLRIKVNVNNNIKQLEINQDVFSENNIVWKGK